MNIKVNNRTCIENDSLTTVLPRTCSVRAVITATTYQTWRDSATNEWLIKEYSPISKAAMRRLHTLFLKVHGI